MLTWRDIEGVYIVASTPHNGSYAVIDLRQLGHRAGFGARFAPAHRRNTLPSWTGLGDFGSRSEACRRCESHHSGQAYIPCEPTAKEYRNEVSTTRH